MAMLRLALASQVLQPGLADEEGNAAVQPGFIEGEPGFTDEEDGVLSDTDYELRIKAEAEDGPKRSTLYLKNSRPPSVSMWQDLLKTLVQWNTRRLTLMKASFGIPSEPQHHHEFDFLPECTRDQRHVGDRVWHGYYHMSELLETDLPAMRYTQCNDLSIGQQCYHDPTPILQIFNMKVQTCLVDMTGPVEVYGIFAVRDDEDYCRNYLFNRSRENPLDISLTGGYLRLLNPRRGMSMQFNCLIEVDIRVKAMGDDDTEDKTLADGCMQLIEDQVNFEMLCKCTMSGPYGSVAFDYNIFRFGFEATIELVFLEVPEGGFNVQLCGYTTVQKNYYAFLDKNCDCDSFISSTGRFPQYFVAAVQMDDYFLVDFVEGKSPLIFKPAIHGSEEKEYSFHNGALVSVKVSWSTAFYVT